MPDVLIAPAASEHMPYIRMSQISSRYGELPAANNQSGYDFDIEYFSIFGLELHSLMLQQQGDAILAAVNQAQSTATDIDIDLKPGGISLRNGSTFNIRLRIYSFFPSGGGATYGFGLDGIYGSDMFGNGVLTGGGIDIFRTSNFQEYKAYIMENYVKYYMWVDPYNYSPTKIGYILYVPQGVDTGYWRLYGRVMWTSSSSTISAKLHQYFYGMMGVNKFPGDSSNIGGGYGDFDDTSGGIAFPELPNLSALASGMVNMYNPTTVELGHLSEYLWTTDFATNVLKILSDPMEAIVSINILPVQPPVADDPVPVVVGNLNAIYGGIDTPTLVTAKPLSSQYMVFDCGTLNLNEYWGSALDYSPYTKAEIYIPYVGVESVNIDDIMDGSVQLKYNIDLLTGTFIAVLKCNKSNKMDLDSVLYHWSGSMASTIPVTASNFTQLITTITSSIVSAGIPILTGGGGAAIASGIVGGVMNMSNAKSHVQKSGSITMTAGSLDIQQPYLILTRPIQSKPQNYEAFKGWTSNITARLADLEGYTEIEYVHVESSGATETEKTEIERLLKEGVIL